MNSTSRPSSPNPGQLTKASGYDLNSTVQKVGAALNNTSAGGWGNSSQSYGQFPGMGKQNPIPGGSNNPINDWTDTRPPSERIPAMSNNPPVPAPMPEQPVGDWGPGGSIAPQPQVMQPPQEPMLSYPPTSQAVMPQPIAGPMLNPGYKPYEEPVAVQRKFPGFNGMMT